MITLNSAPNKATDRLARVLYSVVCLFVAGQLSANPAIAKGPPKPVELLLTIGADGGGLSPTEMRFERGRLYKLTVSNKTDKPRYFVATEMAGRIFTAKVEVYDASGKMAGEVHGQAHRFEISPGASIGWFFYPMAKGTGLTIESARKGTASMTATVEIYGAAPIISK